MQNFKVKQINESGPIIEKTLTETELKELGFFPLEPSELEDLKIRGRVSICGSHKFTIIEPITHALYYLNADNKPELKIFDSKAEAEKYRDQNSIASVPSPYFQ